MVPQQFKVKIYSDHAVVNGEFLVAPLSKLGARLLEMGQDAVPVKKTRKAVKEAPAKKTRKRRTKKEKPEPPVEEAGNELGL